MKLVPTPLSQKPLPLALSLSALLFALPVAAVTAPRPKTTAPAKTSYERDVLPLFQRKCLGCHGAGQPHAGLDVTSAGALLEGGYSGPSVVPGSPEKSLLYQMLVDGRMPKGGGRFSAAELKSVAAWIRAGAPGEATTGHWAFRSPRLPAVPPVKHAALVRNPIDNFLLADLERKGLAYSPEADPRTLIRRVTYDLIGLPPTPEEVEAFVRECSPNTGHPTPDTDAAYRRLVDRLLALPQYGERWARHWLDIAGYADSEGVLQEDRIRPNAWRYRDYVIRAFNADKPYDQFLREQIAGDEISDYRHAKAFTPELVDTLAATGFLRTAVDATRDDFNPHQFGEYQYRMLHDTQTIVMSTTLGLTVQCARCHDHKYEPVSQKDYYRLQGLFTPAIRPRGTLLPTNRRQIIAGTAEQQQQAKETNARIDAAVAQLNQQQLALAIEYRLKYLEEKSDTVPEADRAPLLAAARTEDPKRTAEQKALLARYQPLIEPGQPALERAFPELRRKTAAIAAQRQAEQRQRIVLPEIRAFYDQDATPPPTQLLTRGDWLRPGDPVEPGLPTVLRRADDGFAFPTPAPGAATTGRRTAFAQWLTRRDNPLTARVMANRIWAHHFGVGIVPTVENFGRSGTRPTNPALLDWLAVSFATGDASGLPEHRAANTAHRSPWSLKSLHRLIVTSAAYRQSSALPQGVASGPEVDPDNRLLWRQRPRRLEAEAVRDGMLAASGMLDPTLYGEPVSTETRPTGEIVPVDEALKGRRSLYLLVRRSMPVNLLNAFDAPVMETNCTRRAPSATATQALAQLNSSFTTAQAGHFAQRLLREVPSAALGPDPKAIDRAYQLALSRPPTPAERAATLDFLRAQSLRYPGTPASTMERAYADLCQALLAANEFLYVD